MEDRQEPTYLGWAGTVDDVIGVLDSVVARTVSLARHVDDGWMCTWEVLFVSSWLDH